MSLDAKQAAEFLGCSVSFIRQAKAQGKLAYTQFGSRYTFEESDLLTLIKKVELSKNEPVLE